MKIMAAAVIAGLTMAIMAQEGNLLSEKWNIYAKSTTTQIDEKTKEITCKNEAPKTISGVVQTVMLNQEAPKAITFSVESKATDVQGTLLSNYCVYLDLGMLDGTNVFGRTAVFKGGTHDWEKAELTYTPEKPIKRVNYYILFRNVTGEASFRNPILTQAK